MKKLNLKKLKEAFLMISIFKSKKANVILDLLIVLVLLFVIAISFIITGKIQTEINDDIQQDTSLDAEYKQINQDLTTKYPTIIDNSILFFFILLWIVTIVTSRLVDTNPIFFILSFILLIFAFIIIIILGNTFIDIFTGDLGGMETSYPFTFWIFNHILIIAIIQGFTIMLSLFAKPQ